MKKNRRIIFVGYYIPGDAPSNFVVSFCKGYAELGVDVKLILTVNSIGSVPQIDGVEIYPILGLSLIKREKAIAKLISKNYIPGETVVQYYGSPFLGWLPFTRKYPSFYTVAEIPYANPSMSFNFKLKEWLQQLSIKKATGLLVLTQALYNYYVNKGVANVRVFNLIIDPERFSGLKKTTSERYISYCGSIGVYKDGVGDLIDAFAMNHSKHPDVILQIIGGFFSQQDETILRGKVEKLNIKDYVRFTGRVLPEKMPELLYNSEVLALARPNNKQAQYGFPSKLGEYLFTGNPVVVTRVGEIDHFLTDMKNCVFATPDDPKDFAEKLDWVLSHPKEARVIGDAGHKVAEDNFSILSQCRVALDFFERVNTNY